MSRYCSEPLCLFVISTNYLADDSLNAVEYWLQPASTTVLGRHGDILLPFPASSISKKHARISIKSVPVEKLGDFDYVPRCLVCDLASKFHTFIDGRVIDEGSAMEIDPYNSPTLLRLGRKNDDQFALSWRPMNITIRKRGSKDLEVLESSLGRRGIRIQSDFSEHTSLLVTYSVNSALALLALARGCVISAYEFIDKLIDRLSSLPEGVAISLKTADLPDPAKFPPIDSRTNKNVSSSVISPNPRRRILFNLVKIGFGDPQHVGRFLSSLFTNYVFGFDN